MHFLCANTVRIKAEAAAHGVPLQPARGVGHAGAAPGARGGCTPEPPGTARDKSASLCKTSYPQGSSGAPVGFCWLKD